MATKEPVLVPILGLQIHNFFTGGFAEQTL